MAMLLDGSTQYAYTGSSPVSAYPFTMACWFYATNITAAHTLMQIVNSATGYWHALIGAGDLSDQVIAGSCNNGTMLYAQSSVDYAANTWTHACGYWSGDNLRAVYKDGGSKGTNVGSRTCGTPSQVGIGWNLHWGGSRYLNGAIAEAGIWNVVLTDTEVYVLSRGVSPLYVRPESLLCYWPFITTANMANDLVSGYNLTLNNSPVGTSHYKVFYQRSPRL